jgi:hypothetical protein
LALVLILIFAHAAKNQNQKQGQKRRTGVSALHVAGISVRLQLAGEGLVQQRLFQCLQRGELLLVNGLEAFGFFAKWPEVRTRPASPKEQGPWVYP